MKTTYYLIEHEDQLSIYMVSEMNPPPLMDIGILDTYLEGLHKKWLLPTGGKKTHFMMRPKDHELKIRQEGVKVIDTCEVHSSVFGPLPHWLEEFRADTEREVDRVLLIGEPTLYTHLAPIKHFEMSSDPEWLKDVEKRKQFMGDEKQRAKYLGMETRLEEPVIDPVAEVEQIQWQEHHQPGKVLVAGCFDLVHIGHAHFLFEAYRQFVAHNKHRELHVGVADDVSFGYYKQREPFYNFQERASILESLSFVTKVHKYAIWKNVPFGYPTEDGMQDLVEEVMPILFVESKQKPTEKIGILPFLKDKKIPIAKVNSINIHTTDIIRRIRGDTQ